MKKLVSILLCVALLFSFSAFAFAAEAEQNESKPFENSQFATFGDYTLHYRAFESNGPQKGQIMLIHGFGLSTAEFEGAAENYCDLGYKTVLVDMPGFGYSSRETTKTNLVDREELVFDLMTLLGGKWIVGGHSMGGGIAANVAIDHPELVSALVLFAPQSSTALPEFVSKIVVSSPVRLAFDAMIGFASRSKLAIGLMVAASFSDAEFAKSYDLSKIMAPLSIKGTGSSIAIMSSHARSTDFEAFSKLEIPVAIVKSANDKIASASNLNAFIDAAPEKLTVTELEKGGHMAVEYDSDAAVAATLETIYAA